MPIPKKVKDESEKAAFVLPSLDDDEAELEQEDLEAPEDSLESVEDEDFFFEEDADEADPEEEDDSDEDDFEEDLDSDEDNSEDQEASKPDKNESKKPKKSSFKNKIPEIKAPGFVFAIVPAFLKFLDWISKGILKLGGKLPAIGKQLNKLSLGSKPLRIIAGLVPIVLFLLLNLTVRNFTSQAVEAAEIALPDEGKVTMSSYELDKQNNSVKATLNNEGAIIGEVTPSATVHSSKLFNPVSWFMPTETAICSVDETISIDIEASEEVTMECSTDVKGFLPQIEGTLK